MQQGYLSLVLHAHLPYVRHLDDNHFLQERWFFEALTECYIPLIKVFNNLDGDGLSYRITVSLSPPLIHMMQDDLLGSRYLKYLDNLHSLAGEEIKRTQKDPHQNYLARSYRDWFEEAGSIFAQYGNNLNSAFKQLRDKGHLELITSGATHGYLPLLREQHQSVKSQVHHAAALFRQVFGGTPPGFWLPECGYYPGVEQYLAEEGIGYFFVDGHGLLYSRPRPRYGTFAPVVTSSGVAAFARDLETSKQVWSADEGYPGDYDYREYYRDIGYDLDWDYIKRFLPHRQRTHTGIKYHRITGRSDHKELYQPQWAREKAAIHAGNFLFNRQAQARHLRSHMDRPPIIVSPYDAELFGHWWFEGPQWLDFLIRKTVCDQQEIKLAAPSDYLRDHPENQPAVPCQSSWGNGGYNSVWLEQSNDWLYRHLHRAARKMIKLATTFPDARGLQKEALDQAVRELLLAQSSDWAFIMKTGTLVDYAHQRTNKHLDRFNKIYDGLMHSKLDKKWLNSIKEEDNIFMDTANYAVYT